MKPDTPIWLKCESLGRPANTIKLQCTTREAILTIGQWLMGTYMGSKIRITLGRTEEDLIENRKSETVSEMMQDLESLISGTPEGSEQESNHD